MRIENVSYSDYILALWIHSGTYIGKREGNGIAVGISKCFQLVSLNLNLK